MIYIVTLFTTGSIIGIVGAYAMIKHKMASELKFSETFLGIQHLMIGTLDALAFLGRVLGNCYLILYPLENPKKAYTYQTIFLTIFFGIIFIVIDFTPQISQPILAIGILISGFCRSFLVIPIFINFQNSNPQEDKFSLDLWSSLSVAGDILGVLGVSKLMEAGVKWNYALLIYMAFYIVCGIVQHFLVSEVSMPGRPESETTCQYISSTLGILRQFFKVPKHFLWLFNGVMAGSLYYTLLMWLPYYFQELGFGSNSAVISIMNPLMNIFGVLILTYLIERCATLTQVLLLLFNLLTLSLSVPFLFIEKSQQNFAIYLILTGLVGFFAAPGLGRARSTEPAELTAGNSQLRFHVLTVLFLCLNLALTLWMFLVGFLMQKSTNCYNTDINGLIYVVIGISFFVLISHGIRKFLLPKGESEDNGPMILPNEEN